MRALSSGCVFWLFMGPSNFFLAAGPNGLDKRDPAGRPGSRYGEEGDLQLCDQVSGFREPRALDCGLRKCLSGSSPRRGDRCEGGLQVGVALSPRWSGAQLLWHKFTTRPCSATVPQLGTEGETPSNVPGEVSPGWTHHVTRAEVGACTPTGSGTCSPQPSGTTLGPAPAEPT